MSMRVVVEPTPPASGPVGGRARWYGQAPPPARDAGARAAGDEILTRAGRDGRSSPAPGLLRAGTEDELGALVAAHARRVWPGVKTAVLFVRDGAGWRLLGAGRTAAAALARRLESSPGGPALLARASRRASPLLLASRAALLRQAPALAQSRAGVAALGAAALVPVRRGRLARGCLLLGFARPPRVTAAALDAVGLLATICAATLDRLARGSGGAGGGQEPAETFVGMAAHELRGPIASAQVHLGILKHELGRTGHGPSLAASPSLQLSLTSLGSELGRLHRLVRFLGDVAREQYRPDMIERAPQDLGPLIREVAREAARDADEAPRIRLSLDEPLWVACDAVQIERVLHNLLSNAIKYGAGKPIELHARRVRGGVTVRIRDRGIGLPRSDGARPFDPFAPFGRSDLARTYPGLGLGLWLARTIVEAHGGSVKVASGRGRGSVFEVWLPRAAEPRKSG